MMVGNDSRRVIYVSDGRGQLLAWLDSIAEDQRRRHPGRQVTIAGVAREALLLARQSKEIEERLRR
jgi:hypothetical protein